MGSHLREEEVRVAGVGLAPDRRTAKVRGKALRTGWTTGTCASAAAKAATAMLATGHRQETVEVLAQVASFGRYAYFTDYEVSTAGGRIWFKTGDRLDGPVHSNNSGASDFQVI